MTSLHLIMAKNAGALPLIGGVVAGIILVLAFIIGMVKGVRKVGWGGFYWAASGVGYVFVYKFLGKLNPLAFGGNYAALADSIWALLLAIICVLLSLALYGFFGIVLRPRAIWIRKYQTDSYGFEYEMDDMDDKLADGSRRNCELIMRGDDTPTIFGRIGGGLLSFINAAAVLATIGSLLLLVINATGLRNGQLGEMMNIAVVKQTFKYVMNYALDFITVGVVLAIAFKGYKNGFVGSARSFMMSFGMFVIVVVCFVIPFIGAFANFSYLGKLIERCIALYANKFGPRVSSILGKLTTGALMAIVAAGFLYFLNFLMRLLADKIEDTFVIRIIDGSIAAVIYLIVGAALVMLFWAILFALDHYGIIYVSQAFGDGSSLAKECFDGAPVLWNAVKKVVHTIYTAIMQLLA